MRARENPYRSEQILRIRYRSPHHTFPALLARLEKLRFRAAIVGPEGSGKTTLLEDLETFLTTPERQFYWFRLTREFPVFSRAQEQRIRQGFTDRDWIFFDGAELLGWPRFQAFRWSTRRAGGLLATTHRAGYLPTLLRTRTSPQLLESILLSLEPATLPSNIPSLFTRHRGNLREALREMYDLRSRGPLPET